MTYNKKTIKYLKKTFKGYHVYKAIYHKQKKENFSSFRLVYFLFKLASKNIQI